MNIRRATDADWPDIWSIFHAVVSAGDTYAWAPETTEAEARQLWSGAGAAVFVAEVDGRIAGTYMLKKNQPGLGSHVANAGFMVAPHSAGRGVGRAMGEHALAEARARGFDAMQFNFVVSTNTRAVRLWQSLGFAIAGTVPDAFRHPTEGKVAVYVMHKTLNP
jgi:L-amino acid N-acyltransferase YncA